MLTIRSRLYIISEYIITYSALPTWIIFRKYYGNLVNVKKCCWYAKLYRQSNIFKSIWKRHGNIRSQIWHICFKVSCRFIYLVVFVVRHFFASPLFQGLKQKIERAESRFCESDILFLFFPLTSVPSCSRGESCNLPRTMRIKGDFLL